MPKNKLYSNKSIHRFAFGFFIAIIILIANVSPVFSSESNIGTSAVTSVIINEVAWAGTAANTSHEWIELRNLSNIPVNLTGWTLQNTAGTLVILMDSKIIDGYGYYLIEYVEQATSIASDQISSNLSLSNSGDSLKLFNNLGELMDTANLDGGSWPAGYPVHPVCSMSRMDSGSGGNQDIDTNWFTSIVVYTGALDDSKYALCGTPKSLNSSITITPTPISSNTPIPTPTPTLVTFPERSIVINEVAWMGNKLLINHEWIELYNPTSSAISLNGWTLRSTSSDFRVNLTGEVDSGEFFIIGAKVDTFSNHALDQVITDWVSLNNLGDSLVLYDPSGKLIDTANKNAENWPAGNQISACTMVRGGVDKPDQLGSWLTYAGTYSDILDANSEKICGSPWSNSWGYSVTPTRTSTPTLTPVKTTTPTATPTGFRPASIILNEFLIQPMQDHNQDGEINSGDAFIEIINLGDSRISLNGWRIDDQPFDSPPYYINDIWIEGKGGKAVFFAKETTILLSAGTDSVRLFKSDSSLNDAKTYVIDPEKGKSWCRFSDGYGIWFSGCIPSPNKDNNYIESSAMSDLKEIECNYRGLFEVQARQNCVNVYEWKFQFTEPLFGEPIELRLGSYRLLIK